MTVIWSINIEHQGSKPTDLDAIALEIVESYNSLKGCRPRIIQFAANGSGSYVAEKLLRYGLPVTVISPGEWRQNIAAIDDGPTEYTRGETCF